MEIHIDNITEKDIEKLLPGDVVYIKSIDCLGEKYEDIGIFEPQEYIDDFLGL